MKIIEAMKTIKEHRRKCDDLKSKLAQYCTDQSFETPTYGSESEQTAQIQGWLQSYADTVKEIERLSLAIQRTNMATVVDIEINGSIITKPISAWILRRGKAKGQDGLAKLQAEAWRALTDRNLREGKAKNTQGADFDVKVRRYWSPKEKDTNLAILDNEPYLIDKRLEVINAVTDIVA